jgi:hypothetical protein
MLGLSVSSEAEPRAPVVDGHDRGNLASASRGLLSRIRRLNQAIKDGDDAKVTQAVLQLSQSRRLLAPLALGVGAFAVLARGLRLLVSNWRLTLVQLLPAMWIWVAMLDLKLHVLYGRPIHAVLGPLRIPIVVGVALVTAASFYLNAAFAFAVAQPGDPDIRAGFAQARARRGVILAWGALVGLALGGATAVFPRWGLWWFTFALGSVIAVMMICYVAVPAHLIGAGSTLSRRDKLTTAAVGGAIGAVVCIPPYALSRVGILMLGSGALFVPGLLVLTMGVTLHAGATSAVKTIKMSARLAVVGPDPVPRGA